MITVESMPLQVNDDEPDEIPAVKPSAPLYGPTAVGKQMTSNTFDEPPPSPKDPTGGVTLKPEPDCVPITVTKLLPTFLTVT